MQTLFQFIFFLKFSKLLISNLKIEISISFFLIYKKNNSKFEIKFFGNLRKNEIQIWNLKFWFFQKKSKKMKFEIWNFGNLRKKLNFEMEILEI